MQPGWYWVWRTHVRMWVMGYTDGIYWTGGGVRVAVAQLKNWSGPLVPPAPLERGK